MTPRYVSASDAAKMYGISVDLIMRLADRGELRRYTLADHPRVVRYSVKELDALFIPIN